MKKIYNSIKNKIKNYFKTGEEKFYDNNFNYLLSDVNENILKNYSINFSSGGLFFMPSNSGTKIKKSLETQLEDLKPEFPSFDNLNNKQLEKYLIDVKKDIRKKHKNNLKILELNHFRKMNKIYSDFVIDYNEDLEKPRNVFIKYFPSGKLSFQFS